jgi:hypothetical protein
MKHAGADALQPVAELLQQVRLKPGLKEKKLGIFYRNRNRSCIFMKIPKGCLLISARAPILTAAR